MKHKQAILIGFTLLAAAVSAGANGRQEVQISGPPYDVATVKQILADEGLYQQGYLQREMDKNGDGVSDETGHKIYAGTLRDFVDSNGDGLDDTTGGELPLGTQNRLLDRNGDGIVDGTSESIGQYVNRVRIEARARYEQGTRDQVRTQSQSRQQDQSRTSNGTMTSSGNANQSSDETAGQNGNGGASEKSR